MVFRRYVFLFVLIVTDLFIVSEFTKLLKSAIFFIGILFIEMISSLLLGAEVGFGLSIPARLAELFRSILLIATPSTHGFGFIATNAKSTAIRAIIILKLVNIFLNFSMFL